MSTNTKSPENQVESGNLVKPVLANRLFISLKLKINNKVNHFIKQKQIYYEKIRGKN
jgi:hypothetical protein